MADIKWVKISTDIFDNRKIKHLRRLPKGNDIALMWVMLLVMAGRCNKDGTVFLTESVPYNQKMLADELGFEEETVALAMKTFKQLNMITYDDKFFAITGWEEYQNVDQMGKIREQTRQRVAKLRENKNHSQCNVTCNANVTQCNATCNATVTQCNATEEEEEEEEEKENHSFFHSAQTAEETYVEKKVSEAGFHGKDAEIYREELREGLRLKYLGGELGQGIILMSSEQFDDLCRRLSLDEIEKYFGVVCECEMNGRRYKRKSHYQAILEMAAKDRQIDF